MALMDCESKFRNPFNALCSSYIDMVRAFPCIMLAEKNNIATCILV